MRSAYTINACSRCLEEVDATMSPVQYWPKALGSRLLGKDVFRLLKSDICIRKKLCQQLNSTFDAEDQGHFPRCEYQPKGPVDPNKFFLYFPRRTPKKREKAVKRPSLGSKKQKVIGAKTILQMCLV